MTFVPVLLRTCGAAALALSTSCASLPTRVQLADAPTPSATAEARRAFYLAQRPVAVRPATRPMVLGPPFVVLENGTRVDDATDLIAVVDIAGADGSDVDVDVDVAGPALRADALYREHQLWTGVGAAVGIGGLVVMLGGPIVAAAIGTGGTGGNGGNGELNLGVVLTGIIGGGLVGTAGLAAAMFGVSAVLPEAYRQETVAFMRYDAALRRSLALSDADIGPLARGIAVANGRGDFDIARTPVPPVTP